MRTRVTTNPILETGRSAAGPLGAPGEPAIGAIRSASSPPPPHEASRAQQGSTARRLLTDDRIGRGRRRFHSDPKPPASIRGRGPPRAIDRRRRARGRRFDRAAIAPGRSTRGARRRVRGGPVRAARSPAPRRVRARASPHRASRPSGSRGRSRAGRVDRRPVRPAGLRPARRVVGDAPEVVVREPIAPERVGPGIARAHGRAVGSIERVVAVGVVVADLARSGGRGEAGQAELRSGTADRCGRTVAPRGVVTVDEPAVLEPRTNGRPARRPWTG